MGPVLPEPSRTPPPQSTALLSGGKDSVYAAYLAEMQGWPVAELLVMDPEDPDSWMFHTPNLGMVDLIGRAWSKPVRHVTVPASDAEGETEVLRRALAGSSGPVCVGAMASSFQWARVVRAAYAAGRRVYSPLWRVDPARVVREEIASGLDIRITQVAAEGLPSEWLGEPLDLDRLMEIEERSARGPFVNPAGEGGEFETLVVNAPFFHQRLVIDSAQVLTRGLLATWVIRAAHLEPKPSSERSAPSGSLP